MMEKRVACRINGYSAWRKRKTKNMVARYGK
jgi:hypothetical protein